MFLLEPLAEGYKMSVHISKLAYMGQVQSKNTVRVDFESTEDSQWPFRLVQVVLTPKKDFGTSYGSKPDSGRIQGLAE